MASPFDAIDARAQTVVTAQFGEALFFRPMAGGQYAQSPDPERQPMAGRGVPSRAAETKDTYPFSHSRLHTHPTVLAPAEIWIDAAQVAALGYALRRGDGVDLIDDGLSYLISAVLPGDEGDAHLLIAIDGEVLS